MAVEIVGVAARVCYGAKVIKSAHRDNLLAN